jgi:hypothetical protein
LIEAPKQRDAEKNRLGFSLERVRLGRDQDGDEVASMVVVPGSGMNELDLTPLQKQVMRLVLGAANGQKMAARSAVRKAATEEGIEPEKLKGAIRALADKGRIKQAGTRLEVLERGATGLFDEEEDE